jgi:tRNA-splicing endonuclease subunit Sen54
MFCWKEHGLLAKDLKQGFSLEDVEGTPMSVQQAYGEMIGKEDLSLEKYQVQLIF